MNGLMKGILYYYEEKMKRKRPRKKERNVKKLWPRNVDTFSIYLISRLTVKTFLDPCNAISLILFFG